MGDPGAFSSAAEAARFLGISRMAVQKAAIRGSKLARNQMPVGQ